MNYQKRCNWLVGNHGLKKKSLLVQIEAIESLKFNRDDNSDETNKNRKLFQQCAHWTDTQIECKSNTQSARTRLGVF